MKVFELTKDHLDLAEQEVLALTGKKGKIVGNLLFIDTEIDLSKRLAYTKAIYTLIFTSTKSKFEQELASTDWNRYYTKDFAVRARKSPIPETVIAPYIWKKLNKPKVNLKSPKTEFNFFFIDDQAIACVKDSDVKNGFEERKAHKREALHPSSLHPKLARAMVNLTGIKKGKILDPFCGTAGMLIEAGLIGLEPIGYDISEDMLDKSKKNLTHFKIKPVLKNQDATMIKASFNYIIADLPYGKGTKDITEDLYIDFLSTLKKILKKRAVIGFPGDIDYKRLIKAAKLTLVKEFKYYIHKSMTKIICIIE